MLKISIPTPCHEDWDKMTPDETGRHCSSCAKSVVDFTGMSDHEVQNYFLYKKEEEKVCGRFKQTQLHRIVIELPQRIFSIQMPLWKKFLAACLIAFSSTLFSCETKIQGKLEIPHVGIEKYTRTDETGLIGLLEMQPDTIPAPVQKFPSSTLGIPFLPILSNSKQADTIPVPHQTKEIIFMGDSICEQLPIKKLKPDSLAKIKNPPKADSINCNTINNNH